MKVFLEITIGKLKNILIPQNLVFWEKKKDRKWIRKWKIRKTKKMLEGLTLNKRFN